MKILFKDLIKISFLSVISIFLYPNLENKAESFLFQGKCGFLMTSEYQEKCDALFTDNLLTLIPKGSMQKRIWPHQISQISLASYKTLVPDKDLSKWDKYIPDYQKTFFFIFKSKKKDSIPKWVVEATSKEEETHKFTIRYLDKKQKPQALLFILNDKNNAAGMISMLESYSGLSLGIPRKSTDKLDNNISKMIYKEAIRKANRLTGFCKQKMFEESKLIRSELNNFVNNTNEEISIFSHLENLSSDLADIKLKANKYCDDKLNEQIAIKNLKIEKEKKKLEEELKIKKKLEEEERLKLEERKKAQEAFDMLSEF